jgi:beta-1,4-mannosyl-glycoprotein beta-1,4-N-acetylglucosaminyltransferase
MFHNEIDMLATRMAILAPVVNTFVVCEAAETHSGKPKPYNYLENIECFREWEHMTIYIQVPDLTGPGRNSWERERYHRSRIADGLIDAAPDDWAIVGDCDEIPDPNRVRQLADLSPAIDSVKFELSMYYYDLNHRVAQGWAIGAARWGLEQDPNRIRVCANQPQIVWHGGWHLSYFGGAQAVVEKVDAFMHHGDPVIRDLPRDPVYVAGKIAAGVDLYGRDGFKIERVPLSDTLPRYILDNLEHYKSLGWIVE